MIKAMKLIALLAVVAGTDLKVEDFKIIGSVVDNDTPPTPVEASQVNVYVKSQNAGSGITDIYVTRASVAALGLQKGADWMPGALNPLNE